MHVSHESFCGEPKAQVKIHIVCRKAQYNACDGNCAPQHPKDAGRFPPRVPACVFPSLVDGFYISRLILLGMVPYSGLFYLYYYFNVYFIFVEHETLMQPLVRICFHVDTYYVIIITALYSHMDSR